MSAAAKTFEVSVTDDDEGISFADHAMLARVPYCVVLGGSRGLPEVFKEFVERGGLLIQVLVDDEGDSPRKIVVHKTRSGDSSALHFIEHCSTTLGSADWIRSALIFDIRDFFLSKKLGANISKASAALEEENGDSLKVRCLEWLAVEGQIEADCYTALIAVWLLKFHTELKVVPPSITKRLAGTSSTETPEVAILRACLLEGHSEAWGKVLESAKRERMSAAGVVRLLDAIRCLSQTDNSVDRPLPREINEVMRLVVRSLPLNDFSESHGWVSLEATATIGAGLVILIDLGADFQPAFEHVSVISRVLLPEYMRCSDGQEYGLAALRIADTVYRFEIAFPTEVGDLINRMVMNSQASSGISYREKILRSQLLTETSKRAAFEKEAVRLNNNLVDLQGRSGDKVAALIGRSVATLSCVAVLVALAYLGIELANVWSAQGASPDFVELAGLVAALVPLGGGAIVAAYKYDLLGFSKARHQRKVSITPTSRE